MVEPFASGSLAISFPVGYHDLHPDISVNFQMNRFYGWVGDDSMLTEMRDAALAFRVLLDWMADREATERPTHG